MKGWGIEFQKIATRSLIKPSVNFCVNVTCCYHENYCSETGSTFLKHLVVYRDETLRRIGWRCSYSSCVQNHMDQTAWTYLSKIDLESTYCCDLCATYVVDKWWRRYFYRAFYSAYASNKFTKKVCSLNHKQRKKSICSRCHNFQKASIISWLSDEKPAIKQSLYQFVSTFIWIMESLEWSVTYCLRYA